MTNSSSSVNGSSDASCDSFSETGASEFSKVVFGFSETIELNAEDEPGSPDEGGVIFEG